MGGKSFLISKMHMSFGCGFSTPVKEQLRNVMTEETQESPAFKQESVVEQRRNSLRIHRRTEATYERPAFLQKLFEKEEKEEAKQPIKIGKRLLKPRLSSRSIITSLARPIQIHKSPPIQVRGLLSSDDVPDEKRNSFPMMNRLRKKILSAGALDELSSNLMSLRNNYVLTETSADKQTGMTRRFNFPRVCIDLSSQKIKENLPFSPNRHTKRPMISNFRPIETEGVKEMKQNLMKKLYPIKVSKKLPEAFHFFNQSRVSKPGTLDQSLSRYR
eukprot:TRINITY_DN1609_c0_g2_i1.p1 TRINITY_DN1609_c0_g2~~TRINITY_DN1609_c0_g2_i1.p1  ORF type:complete len:273 (+),score=45.08 TRINITY_DN1609_c0_g2_i1:36-854(+)